MDRFERRLERVLRKIGRTILQDTLRQIEAERADEVPARIEWQGETFRRNRMTTQTIDTRFGQITPRRWFFPNDAVCEMTPESSWHSFAVSLTSKLSTRSVRHFGATSYPFHTHSMACGRNCTFALPTP